MNKVLHILYPDKFTIPFYHFISTDLQLKNHEFLFVNDDILKGKINIKDCYYFKNPIRYNLIRNAFYLLWLGVRAKKIILHAAPLDFLFLLLPFLLKKSAWVIQGGIDMPPIKNKYTVRERLYQRFLRAIPVHITHIEEDSKYVNLLLQNNARFYYSPVYISNISVVSDFNPTLLENKSELNILVGNSTDPSNNHIEIFEILQKHLDRINKIYCPLSYGIYSDHKLKVIQKGKEMFGERFVALVEFMDYESYRLLLKQIDIAIFNHRRQQAMGLTITLLSLGKILYMNSSSNAFKSLTKRGFQVYDINSLQSEDIMKNREVTNNRKLVNQYYSKDVLIKSISLLEYI